MHARMLFLHVATKLMIVAPNHWRAGDSSFVLSIVYASTHQTGIKHDTPAPTAQIPAIQAIMDSRAAVARSWLFDQLG